MSSLYKFACFDCLVSFNRPALIKGNNYTAWLAESELKHVCPNCGKTLAFMGRNFRSPKRAAVSKWLASKLLWEAGFRYVGSGSHESEALPETPSSAKEFIRLTKHHVQKVSTVQKWD
ncbi:hypothetical protein CRN32_07430 [Vibrio vulnificus]|nr:hypothetical protein BJD94_03430 [Vibrio vulnificus Env1]EGR0753543.1 hypothetical protein [Vibrio vulnificus]MUT64095.1 hypothetical protein [Vibrio parahaemolyticus]EGR1894326.1 hypothetical protein [Vibrio vulnificus]OJI31446.1 hypothetical protein VV99743_02982 [Vibrio vulnificus]